MPARKERIEGGLWGLLIGDALGVPYEFHPAQDLPAVQDIEMAPPLSFARAHASVPPGTWSDDGAQALILLDSLLARDCLDLDDFGRRLVAWYEHGYMAVDGIVFDVGVQTGAALRQIMDGCPAPQAGSSNPQANGNGSLMRVLPLALWHQGSDTELVEDAHLQSLVTHGHMRSQVCCALYCLWARRILEQSEQPWPDTIDTLRRIYGPDSEATTELEWSIRPDELIPGQGSGYVVDCLRSARWVLQEPSYEQVVKAAIALGRDTDTTACVAGGIAGIRDGVYAIPERWREQLRGAEIVEPLLEGLLRRAP